MDDATRDHMAVGAADVYEDVLVPALFDQWPGRVLEGADVGAGHRVLDVGCGTGILAREALSWVGPDGMVVGVDPNPLMLSVARRSSDRVEWVEGHAERLPFDAESFDRSVSQFALMYVVDRETAIREMSRVLRPGGRVAVATWASLDENPGYAAFIDLLRRVVGAEAARAMTAPFVLGDQDEVRRLLEGRFGEVTVTIREGVARYDSIEAWVRTDARGPLLADPIDDEPYGVFLREAQGELAGFTTDGGAVTFRAPALIGTGTRRA